MSLPSDYTRLEYIESTGTQWIDTKVNPSEARILIDAYILESNTGGDHHIASASWAETGKPEFFNVMRLRADRTGFAARYANGNLRNVEHQGNVYGRHIFDRKFVTAPYTVQVDEATALTLTPSIVGSINCHLPLFAFRRNNGSCSGFISMRLYSCKIWKTIAYEGTPLVRDFIPCKNASGEVGLWDDVNSVFYGNAGTGTFIAGELPALTAHKTLVNGTVYEVTGGKCMVNGTVYNILKGRTLIDGTGWDIAFPSAEPDVSKTWYFNNTIDVSIGRTFAINFLSGGLSCQQLQVGDFAGYLVYYSGGNAYLAYSSKANSWYNGTNYRTITFEEAPSGDLLTWLQANATPQ